MIRNNLLKSRKKLSPLAIILLLAFLALSKKPSPQSQAKENASRKISSNNSENLTVISWNALNFGDDKKKKLEEAYLERKVDIIKVLAETFRNADIIALQEINTQNFENALNLFREKIQEAWGEGETACWGFSQPASVQSREAERFAFFWRDSRIHYVTTEGQIISCKDKNSEKISFINTPIVKELMVEEMGRPPSFATFYFRPKNQKFHYVSLHLRPSGKKPQEEIAPLFKSLSREKNEFQNPTLGPTQYPTIISGDFNLSDAHPAFEIARLNGFQSTFKNEKTSLHLKTKELNKAYDNIWTRAGKTVSLKTIDKKVFPLFELFPKDWEQKFIFYRISDHSPIQATFEFHN
jgi:endonuclease/exonuclease/phosphatase family metal-dependent hydrolase